MRSSNDDTTAVPTRVLGLLAAARAAEAQPATGVARIGFLMSNSPSAIADRIAAFSQGLHELGYVEGRNIVIEYRSADERVGRLPELARELVRLKVNVIVTAGPTVTRAAKEATRTIPIVMGFDGDPIGNGFIVSLARPGGNITGLSSLSPEIGGKQLQLLKEIVPRLSRVAVFGTSNQPGTTQALREVKLAAETLQVKVQYFDVLDARDLETVFQRARKARADAVLALSSRVFVAHSKQLVDLAATSRLPMMYSQREHVRHGGLGSYGVSNADMYRRAATYVEKILKGATPADLPVEQPTKFELVVNLRTAKALGLTIPPAVLARSDEVIRQ